MDEQDTLFGMSSEMDDALELIRADKGETYQPGFWHWARDNWAIFKRFQIEADKVRARGRARYSARTIGEVLRHETVLRENNPMFKINDHWWPDCARLYMKVRDCEGFFEQRKRSATIEPSTC